MIIIKVGNGKSLDSALKEFKNKVAKTKLVQQLREKQSYTKKSIKRRQEVLKATWKESLKKDDE
jgi:small subunit ribosomal protein S21